MDKQFSIAAPWPEEKPSRIMVDCFGCAEYVVAVRDRLIRFEWSDRFGPLPIRKDGRELLSIGPNHGFWLAVSLWRLQGSRLDGNKAIWHAPKRPVLKHLGGRNYEVIEAGEPGYDWGNADKFTGTIGGID